MTANIEDWAVGVVYGVDDVVIVTADQAQFNNRMYRCLVGHTALSFATDYGNTLWEDIKTQGIQGLTGTQGIAGPQGVAGANGANGANGATGANGIFSAIADLGEAQAGTDNTKGMTPLRTKQSIDYNLTADRVTIGNNTTAAANAQSKADANEIDIAAIVIDSAQITTNKNDIAGHETRLDQHDIDLAAINVDTAQITTNKNDISDIMTTEFPARDAEISTLKTRVGTLEASSLLIARAAGQQRANNNQAVAQDISGSDLPGEDGKGNRFELNTAGAKSARIHMEIYRSDDAEVRFTTCVLLLHFIPGLNQWKIERESSTIIVGDPDGVVFDVTTAATAIPGEYLATVNYVTDNMVGGNYKLASYVKFLMQEIKDTF